MTVAITAPRDFLGTGGLLGGLFLLLFLLERLVPLRRRTRGVLGRVGVNICLSALAFAAGTLVVKTATQSVSQWVVNARFGLMQLIRLPFWAQGIAVFLLMDLTFYYWHYANHRIPILWRFHNVHHADPDLDVTTSARFHVVEVLLSTGFRVVQVCIIGVPLFWYVTYELLFQSATFFHHSNVRLPIRVERLLNTVLVTPRMHGIHHSDYRSETNSNYSVIFRWWDALHRTLRLGVPQSELRIGVPAYQKAEDNDIRRLLALPFRRQRDYWRSPEGERIKRSQVPGTLSSTIMLE